MDYEIGGLMVAILLSLWIILTRRHSHPTTEEQPPHLPPGPNWWQVIRTMSELRSSPHESFAKLSRTYGPIMTLWLGTMCTVVISSEQTAREMFKNHDTVLAGRKIYESMKGDFGNEGSIITSQYGSHWRMMRRLYNLHFFVAPRLDAMRDVRSRCVANMVEFIKKESAEGSKGIDIGRFIFLMNFNLIGNLLFSKDLLHPKSERGARFFFHTGKVMEMAGRPNVADYLPVLRRVDPQGIRRHTQFHVERAFEIAGEFIKERMEMLEKVGRYGNEEKRKDFLDVLLEFGGGGGGHGGGGEETFTFSARTINVIVFEMFTAGTDTTTSTLEWAMAELLHNPQLLNKAQAEIRTQIGPKNKLQEKHIDNLPYLKAIIKETLRLHPPLPFLVPHKAMEPCKMLGYFIPKETQILVNVWAIGRDPKIWKDPLIFRPERFFEADNRNVDYKGHNFEFIPFGSGRRICPALPLASRLLPLALGSLLYSFDWVLSDGIRAQDLDMSERMGITLKKYVPLKAVPVPYKFEEIN